jgi:hypothetical protein
MVVIGAIAVAIMLTGELEPICKIRHSVGISYHDETLIREQVVPVASDFDFSSGSGVGLKLSTRIQSVVLLAIPGLSIGTLTALALCLRRPRPPLAQLARRPGTAATVAVALALIAVSFQWPKYPGWLDRLFGFRVRDWWGWRMFVWYSLPRPAGFAVALTWAMLRLGGRWEADPGWQDRLGRLIGICWLGTAAASVTVTWLHALWL